MNAIKTLVQLETSGYEGVQPAEKLALGGRMSEITYKLRALLLLSLSLANNHARALGRRAALIACDDLFQFCV